MVDRNDIDTERLAWEEKMADMKQLGEKLWDQAEELCNSGVYSHEHGMARLMYTDVPRILKEKIGDANLDLDQYAVYHALKGSTVSYKEVRSLDMANHEIENFMRELDEKFTKAKETGNLNLDEQTNF